MKRLKKTRLVKESSSMDKVDSKLLKEVQRKLGEAQDCLVDAGYMLEEELGEDDELVKKVYSYANALDETLMQLGNNILGRGDKLTESIEEDDGSKVMVDLRLFAQGDQWGAIAELEDGTEVPIWAVNGNDPDEIPPWETSEAEYERWYNLALDEAHDQGFVLEGELG
jgi:hypothetical protein